ncbi:MAG: efflux RND transporter periplasmic adaptor subunit [Bacteroidetes bacterium]|nr:MAG: efflux RND transporter periplasmic adaptor subunit [Bacteroidota bacterium]
MKPFQQISISIPLFSLLIFGACHSDIHSNAATEDTIVVKTVPVTLSSYSPRLEYSGTIASVEEAKLSFKIGGIISRIFVREGDFVKKGQILATLDLTEINAQVKQANQNVEKLSRDEIRMKNLLADTAATLEQYQNAQTQLNVGKENLRIAQFNQAYAQIRAAASGTIAKKLMNEGEFASAGTPVLMMNGTSSHDWVLRFGASDKDWAALRVNDRAVILVDAYPDQPLQGSVSKIEQSADPSSGTYEVEVSVLPGNKKLAPGLFATVSIQAQNSNQQLGMIPVEALAEADKKSGFVYSVNEDGKSVARHKVQIAFIEKDSVAIVGGIQNVRAVVKEGVGYLTENSRVKLLKSNP